MCSVHSTASRKQNKKQKSKRSAQNKITHVLVVCTFFFVLLPGSRCLRLVATGGNRPITCKCKSKPTNRNLSNSIKSQYMLGVFSQVSLRSWSKQTYSKIATLHAPTCRARSSPLVRGSGLLLTVMLQRHARTNTWGIIKQKLPKGFYERPNAQSTHLKRGCWLYLQRAACLGHNKNPKTMLCTSNIYCLYNSSPFWCCKRRARAHNSHTPANSEINFQKHFSETTKGYLEQATFLRNAVLGARHMFRI